MSQNIEEAAFADSAQLGASTASAQSQWVVMKFGGSALEAPDSWEIFAALVAARLQAGLRPVAVMSALRGVTNLLEELVDAAATRFPAKELASLRRRHMLFVKDLGVKDASQVTESFAVIEHLVRTVVDDGEVSLAARAGIIACGEVLATSIGYSFLREHNVAVHREDARGILVSRDHQGRSPAQHYLSAVCGCDFDPRLEGRLRTTDGVVITEGYIAANRHGETVLLGREGSDTSAAYIASKIRARRLEIWTDVPGMFSADPRLVPSARLLVELSYDEAQELSSTGSRILHPRCIAPLRADGIPLFVRCTATPELEGTRVSAVTRSTKPQVKGISVRTGVTLISMEGASMWHEVGFLARAFSTFASHGVSIDLVSTSESSVVVSIDAQDGVLSSHGKHALIQDLGLLCQVRLIEDCAVVSIIGRRIRAVFSALAPAFAVFEEEKIHLISQAANDLNFSFVIDQRLLPKIIGKYHASVIGDARDSDVFGSTWDALVHKKVDASVERLPWWQVRKNALLQLADKQFNAYVYDADSIRSAARQVMGMSSVDRCYYAMKANFNPDILRILASEGLYFDCVSPAEVRHLCTAVPALNKERILLTLNFAPRSEYEWALGQGLLVTLDNLYPLRAWPELFDGRELFIRMDPGRGHGHHEHVKTAGAQSKFGIPIFEVQGLVELLDQANATVTGIHAHSGSGISDPDNWRTVAEELVSVARRFPEAHTLDLGGGFGVPEKPGDPAFDIDTLNDLLTSFKAEYPGYDIWLEPGRYLVARAGVLLTKVTQTKGKGDRRYVGVGTGMNSLIRPALYGAYHEIVNLSRVDEPATELATVVGPICESGDKLGSDRMLPHCQENDVMLIANTGAYGHVMGSRYNLREVAPEFVLAESVSITKPDKEI